MFIGHFAVGLASRRWAPRTSLVLLLLAPTFADVLFPLFVLAGIETARLVANPNPFLVIQLDHMPWSHSLLMDAVWAALLGWVAARGPDGRRGFAVVAVGVLSHWLLDFVTHRPDMPLWPGSPKFGLMLWQSITWTLMVEGALFIAAVAVYLRSTRARGGLGHVALWSFLALLAFGYLSQLAGGDMSATPMRTMAVIGLVMTGISLAWVWWIDRTRDTTVAP